MSWVRIPPRENRVECEELFCKTNKKLFKKNILVFIEPTIPNTHTLHKYYTNTVYSLKTVTLYIACFNV